MITTRTELLPYKDNGERIIPSERINIDELSMTILATKTVNYALLAQRSETEGDAETANTYTEEARNLWKWTAGNENREELLSHARQHLESFLEDPTYIFQSISLEGSEIHDWLLRRTG